MSALIFPYLLLSSLSLSVSLSLPLLSILSLCIYPLDCPFISPSFPLHFPFISPSFPSHVSSFPFISRHCLSFPRYVPFISCQFHLHVPVIFSVFRLHFRFMSHSLPAISLHVPSRPLIFSSLSVISLHLPCISHTSFVRACLYQFVGNLGGNWGDILREVGGDFWGICGHFGKIVGTFVEIGGEIWEYGGGGEIWRKIWGRLGGNLGELTGYWGEVGGKLGGNWGVKRYCYRQGLTHLHSLYKSRKEGGQGSRKTLCFSMVSAKGNHKTPCFSMFSAKGSAKPEPAERGSRGIRAWDPCFVIKLPRGTWGGRVAGKIEAYASPRSFFLYLSA